MIKYVFVCGNCGKTKVDDTCVYNIRCDECGLGYFQNTGLLQTEWESIKKEARKDIVDSIVQAEQMPVEELDVATSRINCVEKSNEIGNIPGKLKTIAKIVRVFGIIVSVIIAIQLFLLSREANTMYDLDEIFWFSGAVTLILGPIISWIVSLRLYAYGQLVENTDKIVKQNEILIAEKENKDK